MSAALLRIEYKLDLVIAALQHVGLMIEDLPQMEGHGSPGDTCPVCRLPVSLSLDLQGETIARDCGCKPPLRVVRGISALLNPPKDTHASHSSQGRPEVPPEEAEDGHRGG